nr:MAG TPA: hypothetical protein [Caudoviricetes sp.]
MNDKLTLLTGGKGPTESTKQKTELERPKQ